MTGAKPLHPHLAVLDRLADCLHQSCFLLDRVLLLKVLFSHRLLLSSYVGRISLAESELINA